MRDNLASASAPPEPALAGVGRRYHPGATLSRHAVELVFIGMVIVGIAASSDFLTMFNIESILRQASILGILSVAQYLVIVTGGFDLAVGAIMALSSVVVAVTVNTMGLASIPLAILVGGVVGSISGVAVSIAKIPPFVATLGVLGIARGISYTLSETGVIIKNEGILWINATEIWFIPLITIIWVVVVALVYVALRMTRTGTYYFAIGGNAGSARLAGVPVTGVQISSYVASGLIAATAGVLFASWSQSGSPGAANGWELTTIACVVIGGVSLFGGSGSVLKAMLGVLIYVLLTNIMNLANVDTYVQYIVQGIIILFAVAVSGIAQMRRKAEGKTQ